MNPAALERVIFQVESLDELDYPRLRATLETEHLAVVRGIFERERIRALLDAIRGGFDAKRDRRHDPRDTEAVRSNFQKLQIGANSGIDTRRTLGRFLRVLYNPIFADDIYGLRPCFVTLARFRNGLYGLPADYAVHGFDDGFFTCARLHQYPRGGGFMVPHRDHFSQIATVDANLGYYQPFLMLSEKGIDYREGGAYVDVNDERWSYEHACSAGDIVVYDGRTMHGVADVDPLEPLDLTSFTGRVAAFVSLFKALEPGAEGYGELSRRALQRYGTDAEKI
ncbi:MAG TPA: hypothetical protein VGQ57_09070 [Polyangiaceae bacterium]|jgi:hypothetical protein|nr:hypothetical protein [Polyangiaceae bacterium]